VNTQRGATSDAHPHTITTKPDAMVLSVREHHGPGPPHPYSIPNPSPTSDLSATSISSSYMMEGLSKDSSGNRNGWRESDSDSHHYSSSNCVIVAATAPSPLVAFSITFDTHSQLAMSTTSSYTMEGQSKDSSSSNSVFAAATFSTSFDTHTWAPHTPRHMLSSPQQELPPRFPSHLHHQHLHHLVHTSANKH